jgi:hypothetical protein
VDTVSDATYTELLEELSLAAAIVAHLKAQPPSAKRDLALTALRSELGRAVGAIRPLPSPSHRN